MTDNYQFFFDANEKAWDQKTPVHLKSEFYQIDQFKQGKSSLYSIELNELKDVEGKSLLHLQCHFGIDTISWYRMGAKATGVDFSGVSIATAQHLAKETGSTVSFLKSNVYQLPEVLSEKFDIVYCSYGALNWLPDLMSWAKIVKAYLKPNGTLYLVEFHPLLLAHDCLADSKITHAYYNRSTPITKHWQGTYTDRDANLESLEYTWNHSIAEIVTALASNGLKISSMNEFPYLPFNCFPHLIQSKDKNWRFENFEDLFPLCYSIKAINC